MAHELIQTTKRKRGHEGLVRIKIDMSKVYDRLEWTFIDWVLKGNILCNQFRHLRMGYITLPTFTILLNGYKNGYSGLSGFCGNEGG